MIRASAEQAQTRGSLRQAYRFELQRLFRQPLSPWAQLGGHIYQMIAAHNFSPGKRRISSSSDIIIPVVGSIFLWLSYKHPRSEAFG